MEEDKAVTITVLGRKVTVTFSPEAYEYNLSGKELKQAARDEVLAKLNEVAEITSEYALARISLD